MRAAFVTVMLIALGAVSAVAQTQDLRETFQRANTAYESGAFGDAVEGYQALVEAGVQDASLFYNLGNAYYKLGEFGYAVLYYERSLRLDPRNADLERNLALVRSLLRDRQFVEESSYFHRAITWFPRHVNVNEATLAASFFYLLLCVTLMALIFRNSRVVSAVYARVSIISPGRLLGLEKTTDIAMAVVTAFVLFVAASGSAYAKYQTLKERNESVVVVEEASVHSGPAKDSTLQFKIHEGTMVRTDEIRAGWVEISLPGELSGWVSADAIERI